MYNSAIQPLKSGGGGRDLVYKNGACAQTSGIKICIVYISLHVVGWDICIYTNTLYITNIVVFLTAFSIRVSLLSSNQMMFYIGQKSLYVRSVRKMNISFTFVSLSVRMEQMGFHNTDFHEIWYLSIFSEIWSENISLIKLWKE